MMFKNRDLFLFFQDKRSNLLLTIPIMTVLLPTFVSYPLRVPILIVPPHIFYLVVFFISFLIALVGILKKGYLVKSLFKPHGTELLNKRRNEETRLPAEMILSDFTVKAIVKELKLTRKSAEEIANSVVSSKVSATKPPA